jgi:pyruvate dehydrogenase E1 component
MNENYAQPTLPDEAKEGVIRGMYLFGRHEAHGKRINHARLLGSGAILREVIAAAELLASEWAVECEVWSVTSFSELAREAREVERFNRLHPHDSGRVSYLEKCLGGTRVVIAATDYVRAYPDLLAPFSAAHFVSLGTDGFGRSDTRSALRRFFEVDRHQVVLATLHALMLEGMVDRQTVALAIERYSIESDAQAPWKI